MFRFCWLLIATALVFVVHPINGVAQDGSWVYLGLPQDVKSSEDLRNPAVVCVRQGWTVENSGLQEVTSGWSNVRAYNPPDVQAVLEASASGRWSCKVIVVLSSMLKAHPKIDRRMKELGYQNLTQTLVSMLAPPATANTTDDTDPAPKLNETSTKQAQMSSERIAQIKEFIYLGRPKNFRDLDDVKSARVCLSGGWSPANSGLGAFANSWDVYAKFAMSQVYITVSAFASNTWNCTILILTRSAVENDTELQNHVNKHNLVDLTDAVMRYASDDPALVPKDPDPAELRAVAEIAYERVFSSCTKNVFWNTYTKCDCLAARSRDKILLGKLSVTRQSAKYMKPSLDQGGVIPPACINDEAIFENAGEKAARRFQVLKGLPADDPLIADYKNCVGEQTVTRFRNDARLSRRPREKSSVDALLHCNRLYE